MRQVLGSSVAVLAICAAGLLTAGARQSEVRLTTDPAVYKKGSAEGVTITLRNEGAVSIVWYGPWSVWKDGTVVFAPAAFMGPILMEPGFSKTWNWNLKDGSGKPVPSGSYTIRADAMWIDSLTFGVKRTIAVTPSGKLAGSSMFPLAVGDEWTYVMSPGLSGFGGIGAVTRVKEKNSSWFWMQSFLGWNGDVKMVGKVYPTLYALFQGQTGALFRFHRSKGYSYPVVVGPLAGKTLKVGAAKAALGTPLGKFKNCYRLDVVGAAPTGFKSFWFAPGVGMVGYDKYTPNGIVAFRLLSAKVTGSDGKVYTISAAPY